MKLSYISKYRTQLMGFAMLWIMWFHSPFYGKGEVWHFIHNIGFYGVDMFLMVSGLGLYFSMRKSKSIGEFYKKRAVRILPAYLLVAVCWYLFYKKEVTVGNVILSILGVNYFRGTIYNIREYFDWFLPTLMLFYLLTPLYDKLFQKAKVKWKFTLLCMTVSPLLCILSFHKFHNEVLYGSFVRIPVFLLGYWIGWFLYEKKEESKGSWMVYLAMLFTGAALAYYIQTYVTNHTVFRGLNCYPALLAAPALCAVLSFIFYWFEKLLKMLGEWIAGKIGKDSEKNTIPVKVTGIIGKIALFLFWCCGRYSLEIYLFHQRIMDICNGDKGVKIRELLQTNYHIIPFSQEYYLLIAVVSIIAAAALHELIALVTRLIKLRKKKEPETT